MEKDKKVAFIVHKYNENVYFGGGEKVNFYIIKELLNRNYIVDIYAENSFVEKSELVNIFIIDDNFKNNFSEILEDYEFVISTNIEYPSEITYSHSHSNMWKKSKFKLLIDKIFSKNFKLKQERFLTAYDNAKKTNKIVISSNIIKEDYSKNYDIPEEKLHILPPGVDLKENKIKTPDKNCFVFGLVGKSSIKKGVYIALLAANKLKRKNKNFKLRIINKEFFDNFFGKTLINFYIKFFRLDKFVEIIPLQKDMENFYNSIDCLLVPSLKEPFGLVVTEAMSHSMPVIASSVTGAADLINNNENGLIIDFSKNNKSKKLFKAMENVLNMSDNDYKLLCEKSWNTVKDMSYEKFANNFVNLAEKQ